MSRRASRSPKRRTSFLARLGGRAVGAIVGAIVILFISLALGLSAATSTSIFHSFGNGFTLADNQVQTSVIVRNESPFSVPNVAFPYSYGAQIIEGSARCELLTAEGTRSCGTTTVDLGTIKQTESKIGNLTIFPNHGNFTIEYSAYVWLFTFPFRVASIQVACSSENGIDYTCARVGAEPVTAMPGPVPGFPLESIMLGMLLGAVLILLRIRRRSTSTCSVSTQFFRPTNWVDHSVFNTSKPSRQ
jgi:hypothetical protein